MDELSAGGEPLALPDLGPCENEADYHQRWREHAAGFAGARQALAGGLLADRFAWIFIAGYQAAIRHLYPELDLSGWAAFAVSEEKGERARPGLAGMLDDSSTLVLTGTKGWVAASDHVDHLIVSLTLDDDTRFVALPAATADVRIETRPPGRVLPDLSQGSATFHDVRIEDPQWLAPERARQFGTAEALYLYLAFLAWSWRENRERRVEIERLIEAGLRLASGSALRWDEPMRQFDNGVQAVLTGLRQNERAYDAKWRKEYKLIAMYSK